MKNYRVIQPGPGLAVRQELTDEQLNKDFAKHGGTAELLRRGVIEEIVAKPVEKSPADEATKPASRASADSKAPRLPAGQ